VSNAFFNVTTNNAFFNVTTNFVRGFVIGDEDDVDEFYLKGKMVEGKPQVSCRVLDAQGDLRFSIIMNRLSYGEDKFHIEYEADRLKVVDYAGYIFLVIKTYDEAEGQVTYIEGQFFDKNGRLAARGDGRGLLVNCSLRILNQREES